jgi:hypothetical protein
MLRYVVQAPKANSRHGSIKDAAMASRIRRMVSNRFCISSKTPITSDYSRIRGGASRASFENGLPGAETLEEARSTPDARPRAGRGWDCNIHQAHQCKPRHAQQRCASILIAEAYLGDRFDLVVTRYEEPSVVFRLSSVSRQPFSLQAF